jgi:phytanoyl-CoA hydroxylase
MTTSAASRWAISVSALTETELDTFWRQGFVHRRNVFNGAQLAALRRDLDNLSGYAQVIANANTGGGDVIAQEAWLTAERGKFFTPVLDVHQQSAAWQTAVTGILQTHASQLLDAPAVLEHATGIVKPPIRGMTFPLHQDGVYYSPDDGRCVLANVYLDDVTPDNGSILFAVGSHTQLWPHDTTRGKKSVTHPAHFQNLVTPQAQAGDVVWFHLWTVHGSPPNQSPSCRRTVRVGYVT